MGQRIDLSDADASVTKRKQLGSSTVMIWAEIVDRTIVESNHSNSINSAISWTRLSLDGTSAQFQKEMCNYTHQCSKMCFRLPLNYFEPKMFTGEKMVPIKSQFESDRKSVVNFEDEIMARLKTIL